eukprot:355330-Chlamydomonas_euryale.AAC.7
MMLKRRPIRSGCDWASLVSEAECLADLVAGVCVFGVPTFPRDHLLADSRVLRPHLGTPDGPRQPMGCICEWVPPWEGGS